MTPWPIKKGKIIDMVNEWTSKTDSRSSRSSISRRRRRRASRSSTSRSTSWRSRTRSSWISPGRGGTTSDLTLDLSKESQSRHGVMVNMHLTCTNQTKELCDYGLNEAKKNGICNIVALRGDPPKGQEKWEVTEGGFACALDLVKHARKHHGDYFSLQVSGYPEGHPDNIKPVKDLGRRSRRRRRCASSTTTARSGSAPTRTWRSSSTT